MATREPELPLCRPAVNFGKLPYQRLAAAVAQLISWSFKQCDCQRQGLPSPSAKPGLQVANDPRQHSSLRSAVLCCSQMWSAEMWGNA